MVKVDRHWRGGGGIGTKKGDMRGKKNYVHGDIPDKQSKVNAFLFLPKKQTKKKLEFCVMQTSFLYK